MARCQRPGHGIRPKVKHTTSGGLKCAECVTDQNRALQGAKRAYVADVKMGSGCVRCGFRDHPDALHLHHRDPAEKEGHISAMCANVGWARLRAEVAKCDVVCANCHAIIHAEEREAE